MKPGVIVVFSGEIIIDAMPVNAPADRQESFKMKYGSMCGVTILKMSKNEYVDAVRHVPVG